MPRLPCDEAWRRAPQRGGELRARVGVDDRAADRAPRAGRRVADVGDGLGEQRPVLGDEPRALERRLADGRAELAAAVAAADHAEARAR